MTARDGKAFVARYIPVDSHLNGRQFLRARYFDINKVHDLAPYEPVEELLPDTYWSSQGCAREYTHGGRAARNLQARRDSGRPCRERRFLRW